MTKYREMSEGLIEMVWSTAASYVEGFADMDEDKQEDVLDDMADVLTDVAEELGYTLDTRTCAIEGIEDADELEAALSEIEQSFDGRF